MASMAGFSKDTFRFLEDLEENNNREWFKGNRQRYERDVRDPALRFIEAFGPGLKKISRHFLAIPKPVGGSMFRIHRDTRFSKDKRPYKTHLGIQFRHEMAKDVHAPGFYLHIAPGDCMVGVGMWHPDNPTLGKIREAIVEDPRGWKRAVHGGSFPNRFVLGGESLKRAPRGVDPDHPLMEDLKRKDLVGFVRFPPRLARSPDFLEEFTAICRDGAPLNRYLCGVLGLAY
jgi:uncharacterized protein (TIGR02453 family)